MAFIDISKSIQLDKCCEFLAKNGWQEDVEPEDQHRTFILKQTVLDLNIDENEIRFIGDNGDFLRTPLNIFALIGGLHWSKLLPEDYVY